MKLVKGRKTQKQVASSNTSKLNPREIHRSYLDRVEDELSSQGVPFFDVDHGLNINEDYLELPREITEVSSRDLGEYLNAFTQQKVYLRTVMGRAELVFEQAKKDYYASTEHLYKKFSREKLSETAKDRIINSDEEVLPFLDEYNLAKNRVNMVRYAIENVDDIIFLISREVTRRNSDFDSENRASNVSTSRRY